MAKLDGAEASNVVVLVGTVSREPRSRRLPSGDWLVAFDLRVPATDGPGQAVPVSWIGPEARSPTIGADTDLMVVGEVRRRFYRSGGTLGSQVDVRASKIVKDHRARKRALALLWDG